MKMHEEAEATTTTSVGNSVVVLDTTSSVEMTSDPMNGNPGTDSEASSQEAAGSGVELLFIRKLDSY